MNTQANANASNEPAEAIGEIIAQASQVTKPAKAKREGKANRKPAQVKADEPAAKALNYRVVLGFLPGSGASLFAHTAVVLAHCGISETRAIPAATMREHLGPTAIKWHTGAGRFVDTDKGLILSPMGVAHFGKRSISAELRAAWEQVLIEGKAHDAVMKNADFIKARI